MHVQDLQFKNLSIDWIAELYVFNKKDKHIKARKTEMENPSEWG